MRRARAATRPCLPQSGRLRRGAFDVVTAAAHLQLAYAVHTELVRVLAGSLMRIGEQEAKIELAHHLYFHACAAASLGERLEELRVRGPERRPIPAAVRRLGAAIELAHDAAELVVGVHLAVGGWLLTAHARYRAATDALMDLPTLRRLGPIVADLEAMRAWAEAACTAWVAAGRGAAALAAWQRHLAPLLAALTSRDAAEPTPPPPADAETKPATWHGNAAELTATRPADAEAKPATWHGDAEPTAPAPSAVGGDGSGGNGGNGGGGGGGGPYRRPLRAARDPRFTTFADTRRYSAEGDDDADFAATALAMVRVQRDELDAIETFANVLYDAGPTDVPAALRLHLARMIWDEARHAEMGQQLLGHLGRDPFAVPCGVLGIQVRAALPPALAFAQIHAFGELQQVARLRAFARRAAAAGDTTLARCFDFTHADELMHCRRSRPWLQALARAEGLSLGALQERARHAATAQLHAAGVTGEDYADALSARDLAVVLGE